MKKTSKGKIKERKKEKKGRQGVLPPEKLHTPMVVCLLVAVIRAAFVG